MCQLMTRQKARVEMFVSFLFFSDLDVPLPPPPYTGGDGPGGGAGVTGGDRQPADAEGGGGAAGGGRPLVPHRRAGCASPRCRPPVGPPRTPAPSLGFVFWTPPPPGVVAGTGGKRFRPIGQGVGFGAGVLGHLAPKVLGLEGPGNCHFPRCSLIELIEVVLTD